MHRRRGRRPAARRHMCYVRADNSYEYKQSGTMCVKHCFSLNGTHCQTMVRIGFLANSGTHYQTISNSQAIIKRLVLYCQTISNHWCSTAALTNISSILGILLRSGCHRYIRTWDDDWFIWKRRVRHPAKSAMNPHTTYRIVEGAPNLHKLHAGKRRLLTRWWSHEPHP